MYIYICLYVYQDDEAIEAEIFVSKASSVINQVSASEWSVHLRYRVTFARVLDANKKFVDASHRYFELSLTQSEDVSGGVHT